MTGARLRYLFTYNRADDVVRQILCNNVAKDQVEITRHGFVSRAQGEFDFGTCGGRSHAAGIDRNDDVVAGRT